LGTIAERMIILSNPHQNVLAHVYRGALVESLHHGDVAVVDSTGKLIASYGDPYFSTYARSSAKLIQAIPVIESGAAEAFHLTDDEIALICASHNAEVDHTDKAASILNKAQVDQKYYQCGAHYPYHAPTAEQMREQGEKPRAIHNNCSGKHAGMLALASHLQLPLENYEELRHPVQQKNLQTMADMSDYPAEKIDIGIDGCSVPVFGLPIYNLALAFARLADPEGLSDVRREACKRIISAIRKYPFYLAGSDRFDTALIEKSNGRFVGKAGAEAVFAVAVPEKGLGIVAKVADGNSRAVYPTIVETIHQLGLLTEAEKQGLESFHRSVVKNWKGQEVGRIETVFKLKFHS
jgi:L-asparaginase II